MSKIIKYGKDANELIIKGIDTVVDIVKTTVGPKGRNVLIRNQISQPIITNDGVTIAKSIQLKDNAEDAGAQLVIQAANKTNDVAGDGTTSTSILAQAMIHEYYKNVSDDVNVVQVQKEMIKTSQEISDYLLSIALPVKTSEDIQRVATISSGSEVTGKLISDAFALAGEYGSVIVEDSKTGINSIKAIEGMKLTNGSVTPYLLNDRIKGKSDVTDVDILITKDKIDSVTDMFTVLDKCITEGRKLLVICEDIDFEPLNMILMNKAKGAPINISIITHPAFGALRESLIEDICIATGATLMGRDIGLPLKDFDTKYLGEADEITVTMEDTVIKFKEKSTTDIDLLRARTERVEELKNNMLNCTADEKEQYERRISNLTTGIVVIEVGGNSEVEIKDTKLRIEDALNSVQAAKEEGIVAGGGYSFLQYYKHAFGVSEDDVVVETAYLGEEIVCKALLSVTKQIAENSGLDGDTVVNTCLSKNLGYNALTGEYVDLINAGVVNAVKVDRYSVINATSVASTVITMGGLIVEAPEPEQNVLQLQGPTSALL